MISHRAADLFPPRNDFLGWVFGHVLLTSSIISRAIQGFVQIGLLIVQSVLCNLLCTLLLSAPIPAFGDLHQPTHSQLRLNTPSTSSFFS